MATERVEPEGLMRAWMGRPGRADRLVWGADSGPVRPAGSAVHPIAGWPATSVQTDAVVRLHSDHVSCRWAGESAELPAVDEVEALEQGLARVAVWARQARLPVRTRVVWLVTWLIEVSPDGSYGKILPAGAAAKAERPEQTGAHVRPATTVTTRGI